MPKGKDSDLYVNYVTRDLGKIVEHVVPQGRQGLPNLVSTKQILESWRSKRVIDPQKIDDVLASLNARQTTSSSEHPEPSSRDNVSLSRNEIFKRIEEDRERHKRLRERRWVQPITHTPLSHQAPPLACFMPLTNPGDGAQELTIDIEFENEWETTSDWNEDDVDAATEEADLCFPAEGEGPMDLS
ncbi:hypothetical protein DXG03_002617 [Asterophora parasitica]|uniref:CID domain-containing protein n=1 Tax=Asterophora parasitica TaxID=117018 RepID=A0A9P7G3Q2_9AGAR|nr:hypothetical protein DXG03_002617 [Asterophora parasitica]